MSDQTLPLKVQQAMNEAIDAGVKAVLSQHGIELRMEPNESMVWPLVWVALEAAAPIIVAATIESQEARHV